MPINPAAKQHHAVTGRDRHQQKSDEGRGHAEHERIGRRIPVGVIADERLQHRRRALEREGDEPDLREVEIERGLEHRIERHDQGLDHVVQHVADADRSQHHDRGVAVTAIRCGFGRRLSRAPLASFDFGRHGARLGAIGLAPASLDLKRSAADGSGCNGRSRLTGSLLERRGRSVIVRPLLRSSKEGWPSG